MIRFEQDLCRTLDAALFREWLETNGIGGFASSTIPGLNTRRYHGLLVAATKPPVGRYVLLSKLEETLVLNGQRFELSANRYPGVVHPQGFRFLKQFRLDPFPVFTFEVMGLEMEKTVFMVQGENTTVVLYQITTRNSSALGDDPIELEIRPLIAFRDYHSTTHENSSLNAAMDVVPGLATVTPYSGLPSLHVAHNARQIANTGHWYRNFEYQAEQERGLDFMEDLFNPCVLSFDLRSPVGAAVIASTERRDATQAGQYRQHEIARRSSIGMHSALEDNFVKTLTSAADQYVVSRGTQQTVIAGYHWFSDWGRDTMIALPGLTLPAGRFQVARSILQTFAQHVSRGVLPNRFPDAGEIPEYNTVDATLWFFEALRAYLCYSGDFEFVRKDLYSVLAEIISWHVRGTRFAIKVDADGLLSSGEPGVQLTWMDAKVGDWVVTPRHGKPVEIQALWYNALSTMENLAQRFNQENDRKRYASMAKLAKGSFRRLFWNEKARCLYDVVNGDILDASIRPNQIFAVSLAHTMLSAEHARQVVEVVEQHLLTPYGLRSLSATDAQYRGRYSGDPTSRDAAYHQGAVWPWLMGPFLAAYIRVNGGSMLARQQADGWLRGLKDHLADAGLGHISEIFEGDPPHRPCGCIAQAWSVAEILRTTVEDIHGIQPHASGLGETVVEAAPGYGGSERVQKPSWP